LGAFLFTIDWTSTQRKEVFKLDENMETIREILDEKEIIKNNPFAVFPNKQCKEALKLLEEYSEEIKP
jgi:hypothetical protein